MKSSYRWVGDLSSTVSSLWERSICASSEWWSCWPYNKKSLQWKNSECAGTSCRNIYAHYELDTHTHTHIHSIFDCPMRCNIYSFSYLLPVFLIYSLFIYTSYLSILSYAHMYKLLAIYSLFLFLFLLTLDPLLYPNPCSWYSSKYRDILSDIRFILTPTMTGT